jgi:queuine/archaeosine tRNA-ribosyltransferase
METIDNFDCVEFQREVRLRHYFEANGDIVLMIKNMRERLENNSFCKEFIESKEKETQLKTA